jgi:alkylation response protein AidB-like acyl-CoA dehydrogenase
MRFGLSEDQLAMKKAARDFLDRAAPIADVRKAIETPDGFDRATWSTLAAELGFTSLPFAEADGGLGLSWVEVAVVMEEMGRALLPGPYLGSVCLAGAAIEAAGRREQRAEWLGKIASGTIATLVSTDAQGSPTAIGTTITARPTNGELVLEGEAGFVVDGVAAEVLIVAARAPGSTGADGLTLIAVEAGAVGVSRHPIATMDRTRRLAHVRFEGVRVPAANALGEPGDGHSALVRALDVAAVALAAEQVGGAERCLELAVDYAKTRQQFGRAIGSFQAIKHACADMLVDVEMARAAAWYGAFAAGEQDPGELARAASQAKAVASDAYFRNASRSIQIHGGIGFTWEHDAHLHFKRARAAATLLGDPAYHRDRYATELGI